MVWTRASRQFQNDPAAVLVRRGCEGGVGYAAYDVNQDVAKNVRHGIYWLTEMGESDGAD